MFFVVSVIAKGVKVVDTKDGVVELYSKEQIKDIARHIKIIGVTDEGIKSYSYEQIAKALSGRLKLLCRANFNIDKGKDGLVHFGIEASSPVSNVQIPFGVEVINALCFTSWIALKNVEFPLTLRKIKKAAFQYATSLDMVIDINSLFEIGIWAFQCCKKLRGVVFGELFERCGREAFAESGVEFVNFNCGEIKLGNAVFKSCRNLKTVTVGENALFDSTRELFNECDNLIECDVKAFRRTGEIAKNCFADCIQLKQVYNSDCITSIAEGAFRWCKQLEHFNFKNVTVLGDNAFESSGIKEVKSGALLKVSNQVFSSCEGLELVSANKAKTFGSHAFMSCTSLECVNCKSVKEVGDNCFNGCTSVKKINFGVSLDCVGASAFKNCIDLKSLGKLRHIGQCGKQAFAGVDGLEELDLIIDIAGEKIFTDCVGLKRVRIKTPSIKCGNFLRCKNLEVVYWESDDVNATIDSSAFAFCESLREIHLPETLNMVMMKAFAGCTSLKEIHFPKSIKYIGLNAFGHSLVDGIEKVYFKKGTDMSDINLEAIFSRRVKIYYEK